MESKFNNLLLSFASLPKAKSRATFLEIAGYSHYENVASNLLAFFLDSEAEHEMGDLVMSALLASVSITDAATKPDSITREYGTGNGRIDLLIKTETHVIGIENKIFHHLANDLTDYARTVEALCSAKQEPLKLILSLHPLNPHILTEGFISLTYDQLWDQVRSQLGHRLSKANPKWVTLLNEFIQTTENLAGMNTELHENDQFFIDNHKIIETLVQERNAFWRRLGNRLDALRQSLTSDTNALNGLRREPWIYQNCCLVLEFGSTSEDHIKLDLHINPDGWCLTLFGQTKPAQNALLQHVGKTNILNSIERRAFDDRYVLEKWDLSTDQEDVRKGTSARVHAVSDLANNITKSL